jgi:hypothetical protein
MVRTVDCPISYTVPDLVIEEATDRDGVELFERAFVEGYPVHIDGTYQPGLLFREGVLAGPLRFWVGLKDGKAVSVAAGCTEVGVHGIYAVATLPDERGHGYAGAVTYAALAEANVPVTLQASDDGFPVYRRLGFEQVGTYKLWIGPKSVLDLAAD